MPRFSNRPFLATTLSFLSSRGADLPAASQEWNERVDIEPLPTHERSCFVSGHDFSRAAHSPQRWALAPVPISSTFCSLGAYPDFLLHGSQQRPLMWFSVKRTTCGCDRSRNSRQEIRGSRPVPACRGGICSSADLSWKCFLTA